MEGGRGAHAGRLIFRIFPVDFVEGFSASWVNKRQRRANEWRNECDNLPDKEWGGGGCER